jgi:PhoPQ-activated pathogenicity-related protein
VAIIPVVIDLLNREPSFDHHYRSYGFWASAIAEFERTGIMQWAHTPQLEAFILSGTALRARGRMLFCEACRGGADR